MVEPEAGHDLAQLVVGGHGALHHEPAHLVQQLTGLGALHAHRTLLRGLAHLDEAVRPVVRIERESRRAPLERGESRVVPVRRELRVEPDERALACDLVDLAGPGTEREPLEHMERRVARRERVERGLRHGRGRRRRGRGR